MSSRMNSGISKKTSGEWNKISATASMDKDHVGSCLRAAENILEICTASDPNEINALASKNVITLSDYEVPLTQTSEAGNAQKISDLKDSCRL